MCVHHKDKRPYLAWSIGYLSMPFAMTESCSSSDATRKLKTEETEQFCRFLSKSKQRIRGIIYTTNRSYKRLHLINCDKIFYSAAFIICGLWTYIDRDFLRVFKRFSGTMT